MRASLFPMLLASWLGFCVATHGQTGSLVVLNNRDQDYPGGHPVYYLTPGNPASGPGFYVEILGGPIGGPLVPLAGNIPGHPTVFQLNDGFFEGGFGVVPGVPADGYADFIVRAWHGAATFDAAPERVQSLLLTNVKVGNDGPPPGLPAPSLFPFPSGLVIVPIAEPAPVELAVFGCLLLVAVSRFQRW